MFSLFPSLMQKNEIKNSSHTCHSGQFYFLVKFGKKKYSLIFAIMSMYKNIFSKILKMYEDE